MKFANEEKESEGQFYIRLKETEMQEKIKSKYLSLDSSKTHQTRSSISSKRS